MAQVDGMLAQDMRAWGFETNFGALAHYTVVKANQLLPKPRHLTWEEAACNTTCAMSAYRMLVSPRAVQVSRGTSCWCGAPRAGWGPTRCSSPQRWGDRDRGRGLRGEGAALKRLGCDLVLRRDELELDGLGEVEMGKRVGAEIRRHLGEDPHVVFEYVGRRTFGASVTWSGAAGGGHVRLQHGLPARVRQPPPVDAPQAGVGSHAANLQEAWEANRLIEQGRIVPALSKVYPLERVGEATREVQLNRHVGKIGVLCLAEREGLGVEDPELRASIGEQRATLPGGGVSSVCARRELVAAPVRRALLGERRHPLAQIVRGERGAAQLDQLALDLLGQGVAGLQQGRDHALVADLRQGRVGGQLDRESSVTLSRSAAGATRLTRPQLSATSASM